MNDSKFGFFGKILFLILFTFSVSQTALASDFWCYVGEGCGSPTAESCTNVNAYYNVHCDYGGDCGGSGAQNQCSGVPGGNDYFCTAGEWWYCDAPPYSEGYSNTYSNPYSDGYSNTYSNTYSDGYSNTYSNSGYSDYSNYSDAPAYSNPYSNPPYANTTFPETVSPHCATTGEYFWHDVECQLSTADEAFYYWAEMSANFFPSASDTYTVRSSDGYSYGPGSTGPIASFSYPAIGPLSAPIYFGTYTRRVTDGVQLYAQTGIYPPITLVASPATVASGGTVTVTFANVANRTPTDWIGEFNKTSGDSNFIEWLYDSNCTNTVSSVSRHSGSCIFTMPTAGGTYNFRLFSGNSGSRLKTSNDVVVTPSATPPAPTPPGPTPTPTPPPPSGPAKTLTITISPSQGGYVTGTDGGAGIDTRTCGNPCIKIYTGNANVVLTAYSKSAYWKFSTWSGSGCSGTGTCNILVDGPKSVTATFSLRPFDYFEF